ncbi:peptidoglycan recognition protein family protein [Marinitenerispora sediminis]|uniref:N-acetylmuramoyl-L-alanine amidase n=1 Tax=Marinitenerispora sediminis TaxID=1931232 RepID=A0A368SZE9_9ACTN|nr:peptidoglycan recognition family protein [Marinitenerispora sediminis]RCV48541.1 N-acetylmuramoyl-L-alanine amidase [Marinitenerispora sediminis]RCV50259.1 N-acetylmuramoyl-L-alanine amidase [Marinitenerispora sediminis]RCV51146.1 N-acetylmuramoyl-L-alanine amidase [Marinitenerispora sediminis]
MSRYGQGGEVTGPSRRSAVRGALLVAGGTLLAGAVDLGTARGVLAAAQPTIHTRGAWNARAPRSAVDVFNRRPDHIVVHHTATANSTNYTQSQAFALSRSIQNYHMDTQGWKDIGQQLTISRGGHIVEGRSQSLPTMRNRTFNLGTHVSGHNDHTVGIENEGTYTSATPPTALFNSLAATCAWLCAQWSLDPATAIVGHRDYNATACPGDRLYAMLPQLRREAANRLARLEARLDTLGYSEIPQDHWPTYPEVPEAERAAEFHHGPALGPGDAAG